MKKFLEQVNYQLPNLSKNLFILFNHWDEVVDDEDIDSAKLKRKHLARVKEFLEQGLQAKAVLARTFFVSGKEACKVQENEKNGEQPSEGIVFDTSSSHCMYGYNIMCVCRRLVATFSTMWIHANVIELWWEESVRTATPLVANYKAELVKLLHAYRFMNVHKTATARGLTVH